MAKIFCKVRYRHLAICFIAFFSCTGWHPLEKKDDVIIFLSNQCTGTNWAICCMQVLTKRKCYYLHEAVKGPITHDGFNFLELKLDQSLSPIYRTHYNPPPSLRKEGNKLLVITRNYREVFLRRLTANKDRTIDQRYRDAIDNGALEPYINRFLRLYQTYERWPENSRYMFAYEDLIENPRETLEGILDFLGEKKSLLNHLMDLLGIYKHQMITIYSKLQDVWGGSMSNGDDILYHTKHADKSVLKDIDDQFCACVSDEMWNKYFAKYATD